ncbi:hypothetical protein [Mycobacterium ulcerans]|uniref:hypothetical protein n=1 Tax=Mycobacterium ulcerans TaxID=1809 RepID=UPI0015D58463|nr:hypothetical protein [Mycobacterium ulcerans]
MNQTGPKTGHKRTTGLQRKTGNSGAESCREGVRRLKSQLRAKSGRQPTAKSAADCSGGTFAREQGSTVGYLSFHVRGRSTAQHPQGSGVVD